MLGSDLHKAAREWAGRNVPVFPCVAGTKRPATPHGWKDATTDLLQIDAWWERDDFNVAIYPGGCGRAVLDVDPDNGGRESLDALELCHGSIPETFTVATPSDGTHFHFAGTLPRNTAGRLGKGMDTRSVGGYVLVPPSATDRGTYRVVLDAPLGDVPAWVLEAVQASRRATYADEVDLDLPINVSGFREWARRQPGVPDGQRNDTASTLIGYACDFGLSKATALPIIYEWGARCTPPIPCPDEKIEEHGIWLRRQNTGHPMAQTEDIDVAFKQYIDAMPKTRSRFYPYTIAELLLRAPPEWLLRDIMAERAVGFIYGESGAYKSYLALYLCMLVAKTRPVLYVVGEGEDTIARRAAALETVMGTDHQLRIVAAMPQTGQPHELAEMVDAVKAESIDGVALVVLDTLSTAMGPLEEGKDTDMRLFIASMKALRNALGCAVCAVHHVGQIIKSRARGSYVLTGDVDFIGQVDSEKKRFTMLTMKKQRGAECRSLPFFYEGAELAGELAFQEISAGDYNAQVHAGEAVTKETVARVLAEVVGEENGWTTNALAASLYVVSPDETPDAIDAGRLVLVKELKHRASRDLYGYCGGEGARLRWFVTPVPAEEDA